MLNSVRRESEVPSGSVQTFGFRPWVRRAGLSIVIVAAIVTGALLFALVAKPGLRWGWAGEPFVWAYIGTLWLGGLKVWLATRRPIAELGEEQIVLRPIHQLRRSATPWSRVRGTEQMIGGDRLILYYDTQRGMRFAALNLNLVKGRREFLTLLDSRLRAMGFEEKVVDRSRYLTRVGG